MLKICIFLAFAFLLFGNSDQQDTGGKPVLSSNVTKYEVGKVFTLSCDISQVALIGERFVVSIYNFASSAGHFPLAWIDGKSKYTIVI